MIQTEKVLQANPENQGIKKITIFIYIHMALNLEMILSHHIKCPIAQTQRTPREFLYLV